MMETETKVCVHRYATYTNHDKENWKQPKYCKNGKEYYAAI